MWRYLRVCAALLAAAVLLASCATNGFRAGLETNFITDDLDQSTLLYERHMGMFCVRAGVDYLKHKDGFRRCSKEIEMSDWKSVVKAGIDYVDERCDLYLKWLTNKEKSLDARGERLNSASNLTQGILGTYRAGANPITAVGLAFGFAKELVVTKKKRVFGDLSAAAITKNVTNRRDAYYAGILEKNFPSKPDVKKAIAGSLRLCLNASINAEANDLLASTGYQRAPDDSSTGSVKLARQTLRPEIVQNIPANARAQAVVQLHPKDVVKGAKTRLEKKLSVTDGKKIQSRLCVTPDGDFGGSGSDTRKAIKLFEQATNRPENGQIDKSIEGLDVLLADSCFGHPRKYLNAYEKYKFKTEDNVNGLQASLVGLMAKFKTEGKINENHKIKETGLFDENTRDAITKAIKILNLEKLITRLDGRLNKKIYLEILSAL